MKELSSDIKKSIIQWMAEQRREHGDMYFRTCDIATAMKITLNHARDILNELYDKNTIDYISPTLGVPPLWILK